VRGPRWFHEVCDFTTVPVYVRPGSVMPLGARNDRPDYPYAEDVTLRAYELVDGARVTVTVPGPGGEVAAEFAIARDGGTLTATRRQGAAGWRLESGPKGGSTSVAADVDRASVEL
jgi:alpha-D-xyloside xylohydrolase